MTLHRLIAQRLPWPSTKEQRNRQHLRLEWRVTTTEGAELVARTHHPFEDGAAALVTITNAQPGEFLTMRHAGAARDSFLPQSLDQIAARARKRTEAAKRVKAWKASQ
jgi:hypothetical protein